MPKYAELVYNGFWFSPERKALQALVDSTQEHVTGTVRLKLYKVPANPCGVRLSPSASIQYHHCLGNIQRFTGQEVDHGVQFKAGLLHCRAAKCMGLHTLRRPCRCGRGGCYLSTDPVSCRKCVYRATWSWWAARAHTACTARPCRRSRTTAAPTTRPTPPASSSCRRGRQSALLAPLPSSPSV